MPASRFPPTPTYGSLNLAQAVQLVAYDWRQALGGFAVAARADAGTQADAVAVRSLLTHWQAALTTIGYLDPKAPRKLMSRLHRLANRAALTEEEVQILRGVARAVEERKR